MNAFDVISDAKIFENIADKKNDSLYGCDICYLGQRIKMLAEDGEYEINWMCPAGSREYFIKEFKSKGFTVTRGGGSYINISWK